MADDDRFGSEGDTGRKPLPRPDREFAELEDSFSEPGSAFYAEYAEEYVPPEAARPEPEDFGFDDIATGEDEPVPGSLRSRASRAARGRAGGRGSGRSRGGGGARGSARRLAGGGGRSGGGDARRVRGGGGGGRTLSGANPMARIGLAALFAVLLIAVLALVIRDCRHDAMVDSYKQYVNSAAQISEESAGQRDKLLSVLLNGKGLSAPELVKQVKALGNQAEELRNRADKLSPPGKLADADRALMLSMQYRVNAMRSLEASIPDVVQQSDTVRATSLVKDAMSKLFASDVIIRDSFIDPTSAALRNAGIQNVAPPDKQAASFLKGTNDRYAFRAGALQLVTSLRHQGSSSGGKTGQTGGRRGTSLLSVTADPSGAQVTTSGASIVSTPDLKWRVKVKNGGEYTENGVKVTVTLSYGTGSADQPDVQTGTIATISPGQVVEVTVNGPAQDNVQFGTAGTLRVSVAKVDGEENLGNNSASYPVTITLN